MVDKRKLNKLTYYKTHEKNQNRLFLVQTLVLEYKLYSQYPIIQFKNHENQTKDHPILKTKNPGVKSWFPNRSLKNLKFR